MQRRTVPFRTSEPVEGVRLVTERMPHVRSVSIGLWVDCGSRDESDEMAGTAHLLEHLLFKGTNRRSARDIAVAFDAIGGEVNAFSAKEYTCYYARVSDTDAAMATDILLDMFTDSVLRDEDIESERKVVIEEIHMTNDTPDDLVHEMFSEAAWPGHALGREIAGTAETVGAMSASGIRDFYASGYKSGRLVVAAAGQIEHDELSAMLTQRLEAGNLWRRSLQTPPAASMGRAVYDTRDTEQAHLVWGCECPGRDDPDRYAMAILNVLYGSAMSSRLFQQIREDRGLAYAVFSGYQSYMESGLFSVYAGTQESTAVEALKIVRDEARDLASGGVTDSELEMARGHLKGSLVLSMDDPGGRMSRLGKAEIVHGEISTVEELLERIDSVTSADVTRVAKRIFGSPGFVVSSVGPVDEGLLDEATEAL